MSKNVALPHGGHCGFFPDPAPVRSYSGAATDQTGRDGVLVQIDCIADVD